VAFFGFAFVGEFAVTVKSMFIRFVKFITLAWLVPAGSRQSADNDKRAERARKSRSVRRPGCLDLPETTELRDIGSLVL
jgi:hypothetical protein